MMKPKPEPNTLTRALKAAGWSVVEGSPILREYPITLGRIEGTGGAGYR